MRTKVVLLVTAILLSGIGLQPAEAAYFYPPCRPFQESSAQAICREPHIGGELIHLTTGVPFGWIRSAPSSDAPPLATLYPSEYATAQIVRRILPDYANIAAWDGTQRWYKVHLYPTQKHITGWLEQASIDTAIATTVIYPSDDPTVQAEWVASQDVVVKPGIPFLRLRSRPLSTGRIVATAHNNELLTLQGASTFDTVQWWWQVTDGQTSGWVEQSHLVMPK